MLRSCFSLRSARRWGLRKMLSERGSIEGWVKLGGSAERGIVLALLKFASVVGTAAGRGAEVEVKGFGLEGTAV
jgi:hypothetical protein